MSMKSRLLKMLAGLSDRAYRALFVETQVETLIPFQIRAMRERLGWTQKRLAKEAGMAQARISVLESTNYEGAVNVRTLLKIAAAFDVGLVVRFAPFSEVAEWSGKMSRESHAVPTFEMEIGALASEIEEENATERPQAAPNMVASVLAYPSTMYSAQSSPRNAA